MTLFKKKKIRIINSDGTETWMSFHGMPTPTSGEAGRYMYAQKITFDKDSRPVLGVPLPRNVGIPVPSGERK